MMEMNISDIDVSDIALPAGTLLHGKYRIDTIYYWGHTGIVYLSTDVQTNKTIVVKEYCPYYLANRDMDAKTVICKGRSFEKSFKQAFLAFQKECLIVKKMSDLNKPYPGCTLQYIDYFEENETIYLVTELVEGNSLEEYILNGEEFPVRNVCLSLVKIVRQVHKRGIIHRDIKPSNIILSKDGQVVLIDYGSACYKEEKNAEVVFVSRGFSAPELYRDEKSGFETDIYSIGALLYYVLTDYQLPAANEIEDEKEIPPISEFTPISAMLEYLIMKSMRLKRQKRLRHLGVLQWILSR